MVKQLLLLAFITVAWEAMGQEAQCVPERAAMVETIRAYAQIEASVVGPRGVSERVLDAMGKRTAIGSSPGDLARWHTWTGRFSLGRARQYRSRS